LLGRDLRAGFDLFLRTTNAEFSDFDTENIGFEPSVEFPISENGRLRLTYQLSAQLFSVTRAMRSHPRLGISIAMTRDAPV